MKKFSPDAFVGTEARRDSLMQNVAELFAQTHKWNLLCGLALSCGEMSRAAAEVLKMNSHQPAAISGAMKRISTPSFSNKIVPIMFFGVLAFMFVLLLMNGALRSPMVFVLPCVMAVLGYHFWKQNLRVLMDVVYDCGDYLLVKKRGEEDTVLLSNINWVYYSIVARDYANPRINVCLDTPGKFGTTFSFVPSNNPWFSKRNEELAADLRVRVDKARSVHAV